MLRAPNSIDAATARFRSYGKLDPKAKAEARKVQEMLIQSAPERIEEAHKQGDLKQVALSTERLGIARQALQMLDRDDYLLIDPEVLQRLWPESPPGWVIVRGRPVRMPDGAMPVLVFPIRKDAPEYATAAEAAKNIEWFLAEDAVMRFNGLPDADRSATVIAWDKWSSNQTLTTSEEELLAQLAPVLRNPRLIGDSLVVHLDRQRLLIQLDRR